LTSTPDIAVMFLILFWLLLMSNLKSLVFLPKLTML